MPIALNGVSSRCATAGSTTASSSSEQIVMPSCAPGEHERDVLHGAQRGLRAARALLGARLDRAAPGGDECELRADEERVQREQHEADGEGEEVVHSSSSSSSCSGGRPPSAGDRRAAHPCPAPPGGCACARPRRRGPRTRRRHRRAGRGRAARSRGRRASRSRPPRTGTRTCVVSAISSGRSRPDRSQRPSPSGARSPRRGGRCSSPDLADDLLDDVLERDDAVDPAELVHDDRHLQPPSRSVSSSGSSSTEDGTTIGGTITSETGDVRAVLRRHPHRVLDVDDARDLVGALAEDRETREARRPGLLDDLDDRVGVAQRGPSACAAS